MQHIIRFTLAVILTATLIGPAWAKTSTKTPEYKRSDTNFYWKGDVLKVDPNAVIIPAGGYTKTGDSYFITGQKKGLKEVYIQVVSDWIEPITPPDMPASLGVAPDAMQIREPQGDVQVALPSAPANFAKATDGMTIPNGSVVKTGTDGTAAVLFGGVNSARLIPNSEAAVQQTVTSQLRSTEVDLHAGAVFSKVGLRPGEKQDYQVHTPFGVAAAKGTDFVSVALPARTDVWIAQGTVQLDAPDGKMVGTVKSEGTGALKIVRFPVITDPLQAMMASSETMTAAMNFIPMVNLKLKALRAKMAQGVKLTANEKEYLKRIKEVPCLIKLALVEPPAPPPPAVPVKVTTALPTPALAPIDIHILADDKVEFQGATFDLVDLKPKLDTIATTTPTQSFVIKAGKKIPHKDIQLVTSYCHGANLKIVAVKTVKEPAPTPAPPATRATTTTPAPTPAPTLSVKPAASPAPPMTPRTDATTSTTSTAATSSTSAGTTTPKTTKSKPKSTTSSAPSVAPIARGPNDTIP